MTNEQYDDVDYDPRKNRNAGGRNKKKKKDQGGEAKYIWSWDDVYDPAFPSKYGDFKGSDEQAKANSDWKARLYHKKITEAEKRRRNGGAYDVRDSGEAHHSHGSKSMPSSCNPSHFHSIEADRVVVSFAPPPAQLNFAPPSFHDEPPRPLPDNDDDDDDPYANLGRAAETVAAAPPKFAPSLAPDEAASYDNPSLRRLGMNSSESSDVQPSIPLQQAPQIPLIAVRPGTPMSEAEKAAKMADAKLKIEALKKKFAARQAEDIPKAASPTRQLAASTPPAMAQSFPPLPPSQDAQDSGTISRAPVRYSDVPKAEQPEEGLRTRAPGQKGFAQRILEKQGWQKGQGLGAKGQGITTAIVAQAQKRKKRPDAEGGGWAVPANMGRLVGGKKAKIDSAISDEPLPSRVVKYSGLLDGLNATEEISENELYQRIGEDMNEKFGTVERIFVWLASDNEVFVKFTDGMGALRATTNEFSFKGNACTGQYFSEDKFEEGEYA